MTIERLLEGIGGFGYFQGRIVAALAFCCVASSILSYTIIFILAEPDFRCRLSEDDNYSLSNQTLNETLYKRIPRNPDGEFYSSCKMFGENGTSEESCSDYVYDDSDGTYSLVTEFNLVCDKKSLASTISTMTFVGRLVGSFLFGIIGDRFGRKKTLVGTLAVMTLALAAGLIPNVYVVLVCRFIVGTCITGSFDCCFVIMLEIVGTSSRTLVSSISSLSWSFGYISASGVAYLLRNWWWYHIVTAVPTALALLLAAWLVPESPRWLITVGRWDEAEVILRRGSQLNGKKFPEEIFQEMAKDKSSTPVVEDLSGLKQLCGNMTLFKRVFALCLVWIAVDLGYFGASLSSGNLAGGVYVNNLLSAAVELPSEVLTYSSRFIGRKTATVVASVIGGAGLITAGLILLLVNGVTAWTVLAINLVGKLGVSSAYAQLYTWTGESVPTAFRNLILGVCSTVSGMSTIVAPFLVDMHSESKTTSQAVPSMILGGLLIASVAATLTIPETSQSELPDSIKESVEVSHLGAHPHSVEDSTDEKIDMTNV